MIAEPLLWGFAILLVFHLGLSLYLYRIRDDFPSGARAVGATAGDEVFVDKGTVVCPECETENDRDYRFCRRCVGELPGMVGTGASRRSPRDTPF